MGRSGGGSGHSGGGHSVSHHSSGHRAGGGISSSSFRSSGSGHSGSSYRGSSSYRSNNYYSAPRPRNYSGYGGGYYSEPRYRRPAPPPPHYGGGTRYSGGSRTNGSGCLSFIIIMLFILICVSVFGTFNGGFSSHPSEGNYAEYAEKKYKDIFGDRDDCMLLVISAPADGSSDGEYWQLNYGAKTNYIIDEYQDALWDNYQRNIHDDLGIQLQAMFEETASEIAADGVKPLSPSKSFDSKCYEDHINWVDSKGKLTEGAKTFYNVTGIQSYVLLVKDKTVAKATNKSSGVLKVLIIASAAVIIVLILFKWWKKRVAQKNKEQEDLEKILSKPLESFGSTPMSDLEKKYENAPGFNPNAASNNPPVDGAPPASQEPANQTPETPSAANTQSQTGNDSQSTSYWQNYTAGQNTYNGQRESFWETAINNAQNNTSNDSNDSPSGQ